MEMRTRKVMQKTLLFTLVLLIFRVSLISAQDEEVAHEKSIKAIAFSSDNKLIITGGDDHKVKIWDVRSGEMVKAFDHNYPISKIFISNDAKLMISGNGNSFHCLWDLNIGKPIKCFVDKQVEGFTPDGKNLIMVGYGNDGKKFAYISLINVITHERIDLPHQIYTHGLVSGLTVSSDCKNFIVSTEDKMLYIINMNAPQKTVKHKIKREGGLIALSPDNRYLIQEGSKEIFDLDNLKSVNELEKKLIFDGKGILKFTTDGEFIIYVNKTKYDVFEFSSGKNVNSLFFNQAKVMAVSDNGKSVAYTSNGKDLILWNINRNEDMLTFSDRNLIESRAYINYLRGVYYYNSGRYNEAIKYFSASEEKTNRASQIYLLRGSCYERLGKHNLAIQDFRKDSILFPGRANLKIARIYALENNIDITYIYLKAHLNSPYMNGFSEIENDPVFDSMKNDKRWHEIKAFDRKTESMTFIEVANKRIKSGDLLGAMEFIGKALKLEPSNYEWYKERAELHMKLNQFDNSIEDYKKVIQLDSISIAEMYIQIANAYSRKGELDNAAFYLNKCIEKDPSRFQFLLNIASLRYAKYRKKEAMETVNKYLDIIPDDPLAYYTRAMINDDFTQSRRDIKYAISLLEELGLAIPKEYTDLKSSLEK